MKGIINLRGTGVPVVDLRIKFCMPEKPICESTAIIVMEIENAGEVAVAGVLVDAVHEVVELKVSDIEPPPRFGTRLAGEYIQGIGKSDGNFVVILDIDRVFREEGDRIMAEASEAAATEAC
jgi:purine-binding chemotaxis protein CheW